MIIATLINQLKPFFCEKKNNEKYDVDSNQKKSSIY